MEFHFTGIAPYGLGRKDWDAFYHVSYRLRPTTGLTALAIRLAAAVGGVLMFFMTVGILVSEDSSPWSAVIPAVLCVLNLFVAIGHRWYVIWLTRRRLTQPGETMSVTIDAAGVTDRTGGVTTHYEFSSLYAVCWYRDVYLLFVTKRSALVLPERYREGGSGGELLRFLEDRTGKPIRYFGKDRPRVPDAAATVREETGMESRVEETYEKKDFTGLVTAVRYRKEKNPGRADLEGAESGTGDLGHFRRGAGTCAALGGRRGNFWSQCRKRRSADHGAALSGDDRLRSAFASVSEANACRHRVVLEKLSGEGKTADLPPDGRWRSLSVGGEPAEF